MGSIARQFSTAAFGFKRHLVVEDVAGGIAHARLTFGNGMIMLGSARDDAFGKLQKPPAALGATTQSPLSAPAADAVYARAKAAGVEIVYDIRDFSCRDPEGHLWNFGTYDPWTAAH